MTIAKKPGDGRVLVINPNSSVVVTDAMDAALSPLRLNGGPAIKCVTMHEGPPGIETQAHIDNAVAPICQLIVHETPNSDAFVIACFSDPGLALARQAVAKPVFGIAESAFAMALNYGQRFGVIAILPASVTRQRAYVRNLGLLERYAASVSVGLGVTELESESTLSSLEAVGRELIDTHGADVLILGCSGMAAYRQKLEQSLDIPVIDPTQAAVVQAIATIRLNRQPISEAA